MNTFRGVKAKTKSEKIADEEHFSTREHLDDLRAIPEKTYAVREMINDEKFIASDAAFLKIQDVADVRGMTGSFLNLGEGRLQVMNKFWFDIQMLSFVSPGVLVFDRASGT